MNFSNKLKPFFELLSDDPALVEKHKGIRYVVLTGSRGSGKSYALSTWTNSATFKRGYGVLFTRYTLTSAHTSIIPEFRSMADDLGNSSSFDYTATEVVNRSSGVVISYRGLKPASKTANSALKSIAGKNILIVEEAEEITDQALFEKVDLSIRTKEHKNIIVLVLNPCHINHFIYKEFIEDTERTDVMRIHTTYLDNYDNLDESFIRLANRQKERDIKKYNHIFMGHWMMDTEGALFRMVDIDRNRITQEEYNRKVIKEIAVAWDPAVTDKKKNQEGREPDADGIIAMSRCVDGFYYMLKDYTLKGTRSAIVRQVIKAYDRSDADYLVIEKNQGGDWLKQAIHNEDKTIRIKMVQAVVSKSKRATPVQALMEGDQVKHVGIHAELEYEMCTWVEGVSKDSPNRIDAYVHCCNKLIKKRTLHIG